MAKDIKVRNGAVILKINGAYSPAELRGLLGELVEAHADAQPGGRDSDGVPLFITNGDAGRLVQTRTNARARVALHSAFFGWVGADFTLTGAEDLLLGVGTAVDELRQLAAGGRLPDDIPKH